MPPIYNLVVSNVPGPDFPLYIGGARLVGLYPMGPIFDGAGLNVTVLSYLDNIDIGLMACRETVPELWRLADAFPGALADLVKAAEEKQAGEAGEVPEAQAKPSNSEVSGPSGRGPRRMNHSQPNASRNASGGMARKNDDSEI
jgi:hypothetical protein